MAKILSLFFICAFKFYLANADPIPVVGGTASGTLTLFNPDGTRVTRSIEDTSETKFDEIGVKPDDDKAKKDEHDTDKKWDDLLDNMGFNTTDKDTHVTVIVTNGKELTDEEKEEIMKKAEEAAKQVHEMTKDIEEKIEKSFSHFDRLFESWNDENDEEDEE